MALTTRLTSYFGITHPIVVAPMTPAAGGELASAVSAAGGLGLLGGGYADRSWYRRESAKVADAKVGCGFITWATRESLIHPAAKAKVIAATGDDKLRTRAYDIIRRKAWPDHYTGRLLRNDFIARWHGHENTLRTLQPVELARVEAASDTGDYDTANVTVGEAVGLINDHPSAGQIVRRTVAEAQARLSRDSVG